MKKIYSSVIVQIIELNEEIIRTSTGYDNVEHEHVGNDKIDWFSEVNY